MLPLALKIPDKPRNGTDFHCNKFIFNVVQLALKGLEALPALISHQFSIGNLQSPPSPGQDPRTFLTWIKAFAIAPK
jgi:hypothetical protein